MIRLNCSGERTKSSNYPHHLSPDGAVFIISYMKFGSKFEVKLYLKLKDKYNCEILHRGCPDFFIKTYNNKLFFVEVKRGNCHLSKHQQKFKEMLEELGIKVFISKNGELTEEILNNIN